MSKFGIRIVDWSYKKALVAEQISQQVKNSIQTSVANIKDMLYKWKSSVGLLKNVETTLSVTPNTEHMVLYGKVINTRCMLEATLQHISYKITVTDDEYSNLYVKDRSTKISEVITHLVTSVVLLQR